MKNYLSLIKFSHTVFALPFAMIGFFLAVWLEGFPFSWQKLLLVLGCMVFARSAAMAFNRLIDEQYDRKNPRTAQREIPSGIISRSAAAIFTVACMIAFISCTYFINQLCFYLSPIALIVILGYSYTKRFTHFSHFVLGLGLALAPVGAYLAVTGFFGILPVLLGVAVLCWVSGFDIIYALQDVSFDKEQSLHSVPVWMGQKKALMISSLVHLLSIAALTAVGMLGHFGGWYWAGWIIFTALLFYQHSIVKPNDLARVNVAFFTTNGVASVIFAIF
ncbi:MAG: UbiA-like polyprenyltransferase, partial [Chitinophagales bacterium]